jgi:hypothetical protein
MKVKQKMHALYKLKKKSASTEHRNLCVPHNRIYTLSIFIVGNISISDSICVRHSTFVLFYYFMIGNKPTLESLINLLT